MFEAALHYPFGELHLLSIPHSPFDMSVTQSAAIEQQQRPVTFIVCMQDPWPITIMFQSFCLPHMLACTSNGSKQQHDPSMSLQKPGGLSLGYTCLCCHCHLVLDRCLATTLPRSNPLIRQGACKLKYVFALQDTPNGSHLMSQWEKCGVHWQQRPGGANEADCHPW